MGCGNSADRPANSSNIENQIRTDKANMSNEIKLLLLGCGEAGKSTTFKQMNMLHNRRFTDEERCDFKECIFSNTIVSMKVILGAMDQLGIDLEDESLEEFAEVIMDAPDDYDQNFLEPTISNALIKLWSDPGVKSCFSRSREYQLNDSAGYLFDSVERFSKEEYIPTEQDVLRSRVKSTGVVETSVQIGSYTYRIVDVGGQRSERKKWIHCFEDVTAIIFICAANEYDQMLYEDNSVNRMQESFTLFDSVCNSKWLINVHCIVFLNKTDILKKKLETSHVKDYFEDYNGPENDMNAALDFFKSKFESMNKNKKKKIYVHYTCATDTEQMSNIVQSVSDIMANNLLNSKNL